MNSSILKRLIDILVALLGLIILSPLLIIILLCIWLQDFHFPFYIPQRVGRDGKLFSMLKFRSMVYNADKNQVDSTANNDPRITKIGGFIRKYKLDEVMQLWNVLKGDMSLVGPRPNVIRETNLYTTVEKKLLSVKPGITDFSSIVFSDLGQILEQHEDANIAYNQLVRPWKSRLGLIYIEKSSLSVDLQILYATVIAVFSTSKARAVVGKLLRRLNVDPLILLVAKREEPLEPYPPPGTDQIIKSRNLG